MKFDSRKGDSGIVKDADGCVLPGSPVFGDTETGEVWYYSMRKNGVAVVVDDGTPVFMGKFKAPLTIESLVLGNDCSPDVVVSDCSQES